MSQSNVVTITGSPSVTGPFTAPDGTPYYDWTFPVLVNGQAGVYTVKVGNSSDPSLQGNDPRLEPALENEVIQELEADPGDLGGVTDNTGAGPGDFPDDSDQGGGDDDGQVADNDDSSGGDGDGFGDSA